jgi:hypothetical protein
LHSQIVFTVLLSDESDPACERLEEEFEEKNYQKIVDYFVDQAYKNDDAKVREEAREKLRSVMKPGPIQDTVKVIRGKNVDVKWSGIYYKARDLYSGVWKKEDKERNLVYFQRFHRNPQPYVSVVPHPVSVSVLCHFSLHFGKLN